MPRAFRFLCREFNPLNDMDRVSFIDLKNKPLKEVLIDQGSNMLTMSLFSLKHIARGAFEGALAGVFAHAVTREEHILQYVVPGIVLGVMLDLQQYGVRAYWKYFKTQHDLDI